MLLIGPFAQIISLQNCPTKGPLADTQLVIHENAALLIDDHLKIQDIGSFDVLSKKYPCPVLEQKGLETVLPGFVDAHTHICYAGNRVHDFSLRQSGHTYLEIANSGGGIWRTVADTRKATDQELYALTTNRLHAQLQKGITTTEIKSGYGLGVEEELRMLRVLDRIKKNSPEHIVTTCLSAHVPDLQAYPSAADYLKAISQDVLPQILSEKLTKRIDIFTEKTAFSLEDSVAYLELAKKMGFEITVHADQFSYGAGEMGVRLGAKSIDHLEHTRESLFPSLAASTTVAVALPGASLGLGEPFMPIRKMLDAGVACAVASDWNPGSAPMGHLLTQVAILGTYQKLTVAEMLASITFRASAALGLQDRGRLIPGEWADFSIFPTQDFREIFYLQGQMSPSQVYRAGIRVV